MSDRSASYSSRVRAGRLALASFPCAYDLMMSFAKDGLIAARSARTR